MQLEFPPMGFLHLVTQFLGRDRITPAPALAESGPSPLPEADHDRADRSFLLEIMNSHPEAVQSETGMMLLMAQYPKYL